MIIHKDGERLMQAVAEYMSLSGPWAEDGGAHTGQNGFLIDIR